MSPSSSRALDLSHRLWKTTRHDIGRKLTALLMASALWLALQNFVIARLPLELQVHSVVTQADADSQSATTAGVYLIVPDDLIVRSVSDPRVHLTVTGLRDEVVGLNLSAKLLFTDADLGGADEIKIRRPLERDAFTAPRGQINPRLTGFRVQPQVLEVTLARRETADVTLVTDCVVTTGKPKDGYLFRSSRITLQPSTVSLTGPRAVIEPLLEDPGKLRLAPVDVAGRFYPVSQQVGLAREWLDQGVALTSPRSGQILVSVPIEAEEIYRELLTVPIEYRNEDVLEQRRQRASYPQTLDIRVYGPRAELNDLTDEDLLSKIRLDFDWSLVSKSFDNQRATGDVEAFTRQLPDSVRVTDLKDQDLRIEFTLEPLPAPGASDGK